MSSSWKSASHTGARLIQPSPPHNDAASAEHATIYLSTSQDFAPKYTEIAKHPHVDSSATPLETLIRRVNCSVMLVSKLQETSNPARDAEPCNIGANNRRLHLKLVKLQETLLLD
jgi:hypothetical protein